MAITVGKAATTGVHCYCPGSPSPPLPVCAGGEQGCIRREGTSKAAQRRLDRRLEEVANRHLRTCSRPVHCCAGTCSEAGGKCTHAPAFPVLVGRVCTPALPPHQPCASFLFLPGRPLGPPPPLQTKVTIVGENEIYHWKHLVGPFRFQTFLGSSRPPPPPPIKHDPACAKI